MSGAGGTWNPFRTTPRPAADAGLDSSSRPSPSAEIVPCPQCNARMVLDREGGRCKACGLVLVAADAGRTAR